MNKDNKETKRRPDMPKRISRPRQVVSINLEREIVDKLDRDRRDLTRSDAINSLIKAGYQYRSRGQKKLFQTDWKDNYTSYTIRGAVIRLITALNEGEIQHHNGRMILYALGLIRKADYEQNGIIDVLPNGDDE